MRFKFFESEKDDRFFLEPTQLLTLTRNQPRFENVEFCFQFDDDEPVSFGTGSNECHITLSNSADGNITFTNNGRTFKLFARERQTTNDQITLRENTNYLNHWLSIGNQRA
jgi:hypothetical protein